MKYIVVTMLILMTACSTAIKPYQVPEWYLTPPEDGEYIYGAGASEKTNSIQFGKQIAEANAMYAIASKVEADVQSMVRTYLSQSGTVDHARALQYGELVGKILVSRTLRGIEYEKAEMRGGRYFVLARIDRHAVNAAVSESIYSALPEIAEGKAKDALQDLADEMR